MARLPQVNFLTGRKRELVSGEVRPVGGTGPENMQFRSGWFFEPLRPTTPLAPRGQRPRRFEYVPGHNLIWTPREGIGVSFATLRALASALDVLRVVIEIVKASVRSLEWDVRPKRLPGEKKTDYARRSAEDEIACQLKEFLKFPDGIQSFDAWLNEAMEEILVVDAWSIYLERDQEGKIANLKNIAGDTIVPLVTVDGFTPRPPAPAYYQTLYGVPAFLLTTDDLIYAPYNRVIRGPNEFSLYGYPPVEFVLMAINQLLRREQWDLDFFTQGNIPDAIAGVPSAWDARQIEELQAWFDATLAGNTGMRRRVRFVPTVPAAGGDRLQVIFPKTEQGENFKPEYPQWLARIISAAFRISSQWTEKMMTRATSEEASSLSEEVGVRAWIAHIQNTLNTVIHYKFGLPEYEFVFQPRKESDPVRRMEVDTGYLKVGVMTHNEVRESLGLDPYDDPGAFRPMILTGSGPVPLLEAPQEGEPVSVEEEQAVYDSQSKKLSKAKSRGRLHADINHPLAVMARSRIEKAVMRANRKYEKQLLTSPLLHELTKAPDDKKSLAAKIAASLENYYDEERDAIMRALQEAALAGYMISTREGTRFTPKQQREMRAAARRAAETRVAELITKIDETTRERIRNLIWRAIEEEKYSMEDLREEIRAAGAFSEARARLIARTEVGNAMMEATINAWKESGVVDYVEWLVGPDPCPICEENDGEVRKLGDPFPSGDDAPLVHPNCECALAPADAPEEGGEEVEESARVEMQKGIAKAKSSPVLYIARHGSTPLNERKEIRGWSAVGLDAKGRRIVAESAEQIAHLGIKKIVSSEVRRAKESAAIYARILGVPVEYDDDLNAWNLPRQFIGKPEEILTPYIENPDERPPGGEESLNEFRKRVLKAVEKYMKESQKEGPILLVTHNSVMLALKQALAGEKPSPGQPDPTPPGGVMVLRNGKLRRIV